MHMEVFNNIDTLIDMAGSATNIDEINSELISLKKQIKNKEKDIEELEFLMTDSRYFNASNELVDKNIEISLKNKITRLNRKAKNIRNDIEEISRNEFKLHEEIKKLKEKLSNNTEYINVLKIKVENSKNNKYYSNLLKKEEENVKSLNKILADKNKQYDSIIKELDLLNQALLEVDTQIEKDKERLEEVLNNLKNPNAYIDEELKSSDKDKLNRLKEELESLEKRELELLTDASVIGTEAKELLASSNIEEAIQKIKELVTIVKNKPYMDISDSKTLEEELEKKESKRLELSNLIDNKTYEGLESDYLAKRKESIEQLIEQNKNSIENYKNKIDEIDTYINNNLGLLITNIEQEILKNEKTLEEYKNLYKDKNKTSKVKANLETAINKKEKEKTILEDLLDSYKHDLIKKTNETNLLNDLIAKLTSENELYKEENNKLDKTKMFDFKTKDLIEEEKDKEELKKLNEEIKQLKARSKFDRNPNEIYDQIEMLLNTSKTPLRTEKNKNKTLEIDSLFDSELKEEIPNRLKVIEMIPVETVKKQNGGN